MCKILGLDPDPDRHKNGKADPDRDQNDAATTLVSQYGTGPIHIYIFVFGEGGNKKTSKRILMKGRITYALIKMNASGTGTGALFSLLNFS
jgi:hypothetical protein